MGKSGMLKLVHFAQSPSVKYGPQLNFSELIKFTKSVCFITPEPVCVGRDSSCLALGLHGRKWQKSNLPKPSANSLKLLVLIVLN